MELFDKIDNRFENDDVPMHFIKRVSDMQLLELFGKIDNRFEKDVVPMYLIK
jgi:DNA-directed RNA polymerase subunit K/omega